MLTVVSDSAAMEAAKPGWRAVNAPHLVGLVRAGARFRNDELIERPDASSASKQTA